MYANFLVCWCSEVRMSLHLFLRQTQKQFVVIVNENIWIEIKITVTNDI